ncbi:MAG: SDR family NAD(P)-dependent oxidoreductase [Herpetosiphonaceae bacterium]|nr:SDR family NAD(P)-dependent oxidoreductase [Herpetosiphonaceae bacterium]
MSQSADAILITGATDGIGRALAQHYHRLGKRLILIGRRPQAELDRDLFGPATYCSADLTQVDAPDIIARFLQEQEVERLDLLIHNAAVGYYGTLQDQPEASIHAVVAVNLRTPIALTHRLLPYVIATQGTIVFISSVAAVLPTPEYAVYGATKAALESFAYNLRPELRGQATIQVIAPGATRTAMHAKSGAPLDRLGWARFPAADLVAAQIVTAIQRGKPFSMLGSANRLARFGGRHGAWLVDRLMGRRFQ